MRTTGKHGTGGVRRGWWCYVTPFRRNGHANRVSGRFERRGNRTVRLDVYEKTASRIFWEATEVTYGTDRWRRKKQRVSAGGGGRRTNRLSKAAKSSIFIKRSLFSYEPRRKTLVDKETFIIIYSPDAILVRDKRNYRRSVISFA